MTFEEEAKFFEVISFSSGSTFRSIPFWLLSGLCPICDRSFFEESSFEKKE